MSSLKYYKANISSNTSAIGLVDNVSSTNSRAIDDYLEKLLMKQDEGKEAEEVNFTVVKEVDEKGEKVVGFDGSNLKVGDTITQGIIPGKIDKIYVCDNYTFVSFLTVDTYKLINYKDLSSSTNSDGSTYYYGSIGVNNNSGSNGGSSENIYWHFNSNSETIWISYNSSKWWYDSKGNYQSSNSSNEQEEIVLRSAENETQAPGEYSGIATYDTYDYYNSKFRESYIIDNTTGLIYSVGDYNFGFQRGVPVEKDLGPVEIVANSDGTITLNQVLSNTSISIYGVFKDKYGQYYILNDSIDNEKDDNVIYYTTIGEYLPTKEGSALHLESKYSSDLGSNYITSIKVVGKDFTEEAISAEDEYSINYSLTQNMYCSNNKGILYTFNSKNGYNGSYWEFFSYNKGFQYTFISFENGELKGCNNEYGNLRFILVDISDYTTYCFENYSNQQVVLPLEDNYYLMGSKGSSNLYSFSIVNMGEFDLKKNANRIVTSNGTCTWNSLRDKDALRVKYSDLVGKSFGPDKSLEEKSDFEIPGSWEEREVEETITDYDYTFYKKKTVGTSVGPSENLEKISDGYDKDWEETYAKNTEGVNVYCYKYTWYEKEVVGTSFGYDPELAGKSENYSKSNYKEGKVYYIEGWGYEYYDENGNLVASKYGNCDSSINCSRYTQEYGWYYIEGGVYQYDYTYTYYKCKNIVGESYGRNPEYEEKGYVGVESDYGLHKPDYIWDYTYTYYTKEIVGTTLGYSPESSWSWDDCDTSDTKRTDTVKRKKSDCWYSYYKYKDGYNDEVIEKEYEESGSSDNIFSGETILSGIRVDDAYSYNSSTSAFDCKFVKQSLSGTTVYKIVNNGNNRYTAEEYSRVVAEKKSVTLQPING